jgi:uncharacterized protein YndB with AHSA1/START domain
MPTTRRSRVLPAAPDELWKIVGDPFHLPRWWPRVQRVEGYDGERFTQVLSTAKGKSVRADYDVVDVDERARIVWRQEVEDTPFARILKASQTEVRLEPGDRGTKVTLTLSQELKGSARFGSFMMRGATRTTLEEALDGLQALVD